jgi:hypothetical protein
VVHLHLNLSIGSKFQLKGLKDTLVIDGCSYSDCVLFSLNNGGTSCF